MTEHQIPVTSSLLLPSTVMHNMHFYN